MSFPLFRFTLDNDIEGPLQISEPGGWDDAKIKLERNEKYHSLVEHYEQPLTFYGEDGQHNGGLEYINNIEETQGVDADIRLTIEVDFGDGYETLFTGLLDLSQLKEIDGYKADIPIIREDAWTKFINRSGTPIDLQSALDEDGNAVDVISPLELTLTSQLLQQEFNADYTSEDNGFVVYDIPNGDYGQISFQGIVLDEIKQRFSYPNIDNPNKPFEMFMLDYDGSYNFNITINASTTPLAILGSKVTGVEVRLKQNDYAAITLTKTDNGTDGLDGSTSFTCDTDLTIVKGDLVYLYFENVSGISKTFAVNGKPFSSIVVTAQTTYDNTQTESLLIHDVAESITTRISGMSIKSDYMGGSLVTSDITYAEDGCAYPFTLMEGLHIRQYSFTDKPFSLSFDDFWKGVDPIFCLGLGYETLEGSPDETVLRIENRGYFYDSSQNSVNLLYVNNIERSYANERIFKKIDIGYQKWESENVSGIDDPQTKHTYATDFRKIGEEIEAYSKFIAASYAIENTRRQVLEKSKDYRLDNDTFIIAVNANASPIVPELDENFVSVTGLNNSNTRYNLRITPYWNFTNWVQYLSGSFRPLNTATWRFKSGEGNYAVQYVADDECLIQFGSGTQGEGDDITVSDLDTNGYMFALDVWEFEHPLTWVQYKTIRENRNNSIGIGEICGPYESFFILSLEYEITKSKAKFRCLKSGLSSSGLVILNEGIIVTENCIPIGLEDGSGIFITE